MSDYYLGLYRNSISTVTVLVSMVTAAVSPVLFSSLSKLQNNQEKALWGLKVIGDVYYDAIHNVVMVQPFSSGKVFVLYVELNKNIYEVTIIE